MNNYSLTDLCQKQGEVFDLAMIEPVLVTQQSLPSHVLMSLETYQKLVQRLSELEDLVWGENAQQNINSSHFVGEQNFTDELIRLANG